MNLLEQDLQQSQNNITEWLSLYNKASEDIISVNFNTQIHHILDAIAGFDPEKIRALETQTKDEIVLRHLSTISIKVKNALQQPQTPPEPPKRQPRIAEKPQSKPSSKKEEKKEGFFSSVFNRFASKEKKSYEMILPEKEQNCYYDQKRKIYVFEGQEPQAPKQIPKPPSKSQLVKGEATKKLAEASQLDNLTAPPTFKRKGTSNNPKNKSKLKEEVQVLPSMEDEPMSFAKVMEKINNQYAALLEKVKRGFYERHIPQFHSHNQQELSEFVGLAERLLSSAEEVSQQQHKLIDRWKKSMLTEPQQLRIMEKLSRHISDSGSIYQLVNLKLDEVSREIRASRSNLGSEPRLRQDSSTNFQEIQRLQFQLQRVTADKNSFQGELSLREAQLKMIQERMQQKIGQNQSLYQQNLELSNKLIQLQKQFQEKTHYSSELNEKIESNYAQKGLQQQKTIERLSSESKDLKRKIDDLRKEVQEARNQKMELELQLKIKEANKSNSNQKANEDLIKEKIKIQAQLKFYEEKEQNYLASIKSLQQQTSFIYECEETLQQENNLLNSILEKRIQLSKNADNDELLSIYNGQEQGASPHSVILQLSDIINCITQTHLDRLQNFNANYANLNKKYLQAKQLVKKIKNAASNENISLNRSVTRLKSLIQTYKVAKEQSEEKCKLLQLECEKLKKNLKHYKEEDKFNKSYLTKLKSSKTVLNQNDSIISLQEDNQALAQTIEDLQNQVGLKEENYTKLQKDLEDLLSHYEKNQARLNNIEKKSRENQKEVRLLREEKEELINKINLLQVKLTNQREKNEELVRYEAAKIKNIEATHEKKIKVLKEDLERAQQSQEQIKTELEELRNTHQRKVRELNDKIREKENENGELLLLIEATNQKVEQQSQMISELQEKNEELERKQTEIANSIHDYNSAELKTLKQSERARNQMIKSLIDQYKAFEEEQFQLRKQYETKIQYLSNQLNQSNSQSEQLLNSLQEYCRLVNNLDSTLKDLEIQSQQAKAEQQRVIQKLQIQNNQLSELVTCLEDQIETKKQEIGELQILIQKISTQSDAFRDQVSELRRQNEDLSERLSAIEKQVEIKQSEITNKSESLLIKTEELEQKNEILLDRQENLVLTKEELEGLRNELQQKDKIIAELQNALETLAKEITEQGQSGNLPSAQLLSENISLKNEIKHLQELNAQEKFNGQAKVRVIADSLAEKDKEIIRLEKQLSLSNEINKEQQKEIFILKETMEKSSAANEKLEDQKQEQMQSEMQYLLKEIEDRETENTELKQKIKQLERELIVLKAEREEAKNQEKIKQEKEEEQQVQKEQEVEGEMEYLLKEIEQREKDISSLRQQVTNLSKQIAQQIQAKDEVSHHNLGLNERVKILQKELSQKHQDEKLRLNEIILLEKEKVSLTELVESLSRQIESAKGQEGTSSTVQLVTKFQSELRAKSKAITDLEIAKQQTERLLFIAQNQKKEQQAIINDLQNKIGELAQIIQAQEQAIGKTSTEEVDYLNNAVTLKDKQLQEAKSKIQQLLKVTKQQSGEYQLKIQSLQREIVALTSLRTSNKKLEDNIKSLELQNSTLLTEKVDLLRSNDNLMKINQKLITDMSPHNKMNNNKAQSKQDKAKDKEQINEGQKKEGERKVGAKAEGEMKEVKPEQKQESRGFFGAISSLFLTPTQSERLSRK